MCSGLSYWNHSNTTYTDKWEGEKTSSKHTQESGSDCRDIQSLYQSDPSGFDNICFLCKHDSDFFSFFACLSPLTCDRLVCTFRSYRETSPQNDFPIDFALNYTNGLSVNGLPLVIESDGPSEKHESGLR